MIDPANPLVARVMVNRVWHHLFGRGLVATVDNFGVLGERPSRWIWAALAMGALGVGVALWPELSATNAPGSEARLWGMAAAGVSAIT